MNTLETEDFDFNPILSSVYLSRMTRMSSNETS